MLIAIDIYKMSRICLSHQPNCSLIEMSNFIECLYCNSVWWANFQPTKFELLQFVWYDMDTFREWNSCIYIWARTYLLDLFFGALISFTEFSNCILFLNYSLCFSCQNLLWICVLHNLNIYLNFLRFIFILFFFNNFSTCLSWNRPCNSVRWILNSYAIFYIIVRRVFAFSYSL